MALPWHSIGRKPSCFDLVSLQLLTFCNVTSETTSTVIALHPAVSASAKVSTPFRLVQAVSAGRFSLSKSESLRKIQDLCTAITFITFIFLSAMDSDKICLPPFLLLFGVGGRVQGARWFGFHHLAEFFKKSWNVGTLGRSSTELN